MELKGVYPALVTPLTADEQVDKAAMRRVVRYCLDGGVHGVVVMGSTGEFPAMTEVMRQEAIETVLDEVQGKVPVLIGCGEPGTQRTILQVQLAARTKASAVLVAIPYYFPLDQNAVIRHYELVAERSELPVVMYNFPQMTKTAFTAATIKRLAQHPNIIGVKDSSGDFIGLQRYLDVTRDSDFSVMSGNPALGLAGYELGARGGIYAGCSLFPKQCADVYNAFVKGDKEAASALQRKASLIPLMGGFGPAAAVVKFGLSKLGICSSVVSAPLGLTEGQEDNILAWMCQIDPEKSEFLSLTGL